MVEAQSVLGVPNDAGYVYAGAPNVSEGSNVIVPTVVAVPEPTTLMALARAGWADAAAAAK